MPGPDGERRKGRLGDLGIEAEIEKVTEIQDIIKFQILMTPGLVMNGQVKVAGRVPPVEEIKQLFVSGRRQLNGPRSDPD